MKNLGPILAGLAIILALSGVGCSESGGSTCPSTGGSSIPYCSGTGEGPDDNWPCGTCVPGDQKSCPCLKGGTGIQTCADDGSWGACEGCGGDTDGETLESGGDQEPDLDPDNDREMEADAEKLPEGDAEEEADAEKLPDGDADREADAEELPDGDADREADAEKLPDGDADREAELDGDVTQAFFRIMDLPDYSSSSSTA